MQKILLVEDDAATAGFIEKFLLRNGYEVFHVSEGSRVLEVAKEFRPDLVLLDLMLPDLDGPSVQKKLLEDEETKEIPIMVVTAHTQLEESFVDAANVVGFIAKPFGLEEFKKKIAAIF